MCKLEDLTGYQLNILEISLNAEKQRRIDMKDFEREQFLLFNVKSLLILIPEHSRTTCSDLKPINIYGNCRRCSLLQILEDNCVSEEALKMKFEI